MAELTLPNGAAPTRAARQNLWKAVRRFAPYLRPYRAWIAVTVLMAFLQSVVTIAMMYTLMAGFGHLVTGNTAAVRSTAINLMAIAVVENVIRLTYNAGMIRVNEGVTVTMRNDLVARLHNVQLSRHVAQASGEWVTRVLFEADRFRGFLVNSSMEVINSLMWFAVFAVFLMALSPAVALPTLVCIPVMVAAGAVFTRRLRPDVTLQRQEWDKMVGYLNQRIDGLEDARAFGQEAAVLAELAERSEQYSTVHNRLSRRRLWVSSYMAFTVSIALSLLIFFGGLQIMNGHQLGSGLFFNMASGMMPMTWMLLGSNSMMTSMGMAQGAALAVGTLAAFALFAKRMLNPVKDLAHQLAQASDITVSAQRLVDVLDLPEEQDTGGTLPPVRGDVVFDKVSFGYTAGVEVLHEVTLEVRQGQHVGIVGTSGAGKSTLMQLLARLYTPTSGQIRIDGHDLSLVSRSSVRGQVLLVTQEAQLFDGTVTENIRFGRPEATDAQAVEAARAVGADEVISALREGYQTKVGERGSRLSVGERQLVALARAMLADPPVIILDEAVSSVDPARQRAVLAAIRKLLAGRTAVIVAHWLALIEDLDTVFVLEDGRIVEDGNPKELLDGAGRLADLCKAQAGQSTTQPIGRTNSHV